MQTVGTRFRSVCANGAFVVGFTDFIVVIVVGVGVVVSVIATL